MQTATLTTDHTRETYQEIANRCRNAARAAQGAAEQLDLAGRSARDAGLIESVSLCAQLQRLDQRANALAADIAVVLTTLPGVDL